MVQQQQPTSVKPAEGSSQQGWEEQEACPGSPVPLQDRLHSLAEAERLLDQLTQEKLQVRGAFSGDPKRVTRSHGCNRRGAQGRALPAATEGSSSSLTARNDRLVPVCLADRSSPEPAAQRRRQSESAGQAGRGDSGFFFLNGTHAVPVFNRARLFLLRQL